MLGEALRWASYSWVGVCGCSGETHVGPGGAGKGIEGVAIVPGLQYRGGWGLCALDLWVCLPGCLGLQSIAL